MGDASVPSMLEADVLIVGGGPVGLVLAYQLLRFQPPSEPIRIVIVEKHPKPMQQRFGRAVTFWCRSMEMLDQIGLADDIIQQCFSVRTSAAYNAKGEEVFGRGWSFLEDVQDTKWGFASVLRQKYVEEIFRDWIDTLSQGGKRCSIHSPAEFKHLFVDETVEVGEMGRATATIWNEDEQREYNVKCRYLIGSDGSKTVVRGAAGIESDGDRTEDKWVRIDGVLKHTTMPKPRAYGALESPVYGNVLWIPLDHGATRIGYAFKDQRQKLYQDFNEEAFVKEAKLSVAPFEIEYERIDWASVYIVGQRVARQFFTKGCIFLAGDACHTHSSGAGQGMNAGMHDAVNLAWKLSLVLRGVAKSTLLETYEAERRPNAQKLIKYDEDISVLVTGRLPKSWTGDPNEDPNVVLGKILQEAKGFNTGLTIGFGPNVLNAEDERDEVPGKDQMLTKISIPTPPVPGYRAPDVTLILPALLQSTRLHQVTPNCANFHILLFAGNVAHTRSVAKSFTEQMKASILFSAGQCGSGNPAPNAVNGAHRGVDSVEDFHVHDKSKPSSSLPVEFLSIFSTVQGSTWDLLGSAPLGMTYYDPDTSAHNRYEVEISKGAIVVLRPDGWIGLRMELGGKETVSRLEKYFEKILNF